MHVIGYVIRRGVLLAVHGGGYMYYLSAPGLDDCQQNLLVHTHTRLRTVAIVAVATAGERIYVRKVNVKGYCRNDVRV